MSLEGSHLLSEFPASWEISEHTCLLGFCAAHHEGEGAKGRALFILQGARGLWKPKFSHSRAYVLGCLVKTIFFLYTYDNLHNLLFVWLAKSSPDKREKGRVNIYE